MVADIRQSSCQTNEGREHEDISLMMMGLIVWHRRFGRLGGAYQDAACARSLATMIHLSTLHVLHHFVVSLRSAFHQSLIFVRFEFR